MTRTRQFLAALLVALLSLAAITAAPAPLLAQTQASQPDYTAWEKDAQGAEDTLAADRASSAALEKLRERIVTWRSSFGAAQSANAAQIDTVKAQIAALGPAPTEESPDAPEIADRRRALNDQLSKLQAPGIAAVEAHSRADGIIRQIDARIRARQASELLRIFPTPLNPINWPAGYAVLKGGTETLLAELDEAWNNPARRTELKNNALIIVILLAIAGVLVLRGPAFIERMATRLLTHASLRGRDIVAAIVSLGQIIVPVGGMLLLDAAIKATGMTGMRSGALVSALPIAAFNLFAIRWIGSWIFRTEGRSNAITDRPLEARFIVNTLALVSAFEALRQAFITEVRPPLSMAAQSVWAAPLVFVLALFLFRLGMILRPKRTESGAGAQEFGTRLQGLVGTAVVGVSLAAPILAAIGYVSAANALIWPTVGTLALLGLVALLQRFLTDIYLVLAKRGEEGRDALLPVLFGFGLTILALPLLALIWGARVADLTEVWTRFSEGFTLGGTRLSPAILVTLLVLFAIGYAVTRLVQGALKSTILPRTRLDKGVQNALVSGLGYVGIFLAALVAITGAGIDLSALGYVVGALSVGIGFGLQNIVQNFVSGIILLIERPISEGDMIEVNGQFGTVKGISVRSTWIETFDRTDVIVPNADLVSGVVTNLTRGNLTGRLVLPVGVAYGSDTRKVADILLEIAEGQPLVLVDPAPSVVFAGLGADSLNFEIKAILSDVNFKPVVQTEILHQIVERFAAEGIEIPFAQRDIWLRNPEALTGRPAPGAQKPAAPETARGPDIAPHDPGGTDFSGVNNDPRGDDGDET
ncbi:MAG: mechanosensitive ion channel family protein [Rhodobacteraceae bacterium]|nr:mechanosensitive ion channel family protein [Paracoccaceae bacterium]